jgi:hypothetical protein
VMSKIKQPTRWERPRTSPAIHGRLRFAEAPGAFRRVGACASTRQTTSVPSTS